MKINVHNDIPIYQTTITPAHEGFIVHVEEKIPQIPSVNVAQIGNSISDAIRSAHQIFDEEDELETLMRKSGIDKAKNEQEDFPADKILGAHVFVSYNEMIGFLNIVYARNIELLKRKNQ